jgi:hypothetical protein
VANSEKQITQKGLELSVQVVQSYEFDNIKIYLKEVAYAIGDRVQLAQYNNQWLIYEENNEHPSLQNANGFLENQGTYSF